MNIGILLILIQFKFVRHMPQKVIGHRIQKNLFILANIIQRDGIFSIGERCNRRGDAQGHLSDYRDDARIACGIYPDILFGRYLGTTISAIRHHDFGLGAILND